MDGDFKTDITRDSFNITNTLKASKRPRSFSRVLKQQGRVDLDADWNELVDILLYQRRIALADILGPHAGPTDVAGKVTGFAIDKPATNQKYSVSVGAGRYYVDGILCEATGEDYTLDVVKDKRDTLYLLYLDVWEREVTDLEDDAIRESALGGAETATRAEVVWQIRTKGAVELAGSVDKLPKGTPQEVSDAWTTLFYNNFSAQTPALLKARTDPDATNTDPCITSPLSTYRGLENQLYRVEIHRQGIAHPDDTATTRRRTSDRPSQDIASTAQGNTEQGYATFKWSRENGSIAFLIDEEETVSVSETINVTLKNLGSDDSRYSLQVGNWVELIDLALVPQETPGPLFQVETVDDATMQVTLTIGKGQKVPSGDALNNSGPFLLRRWDYETGDPADSEGENRPITLADDGAAMLIENHWLTLEKGVQIEFYHDINSKEATQYRAGDYWLIPARTATGELEWPLKKDTTKKRIADTLPPHGVAHHYAPLALVTLTADGAIAQTANITDLRRKIKQGWDTL